MGGVRKRGEPCTEGWRGSIDSITLSNKARKGRRHRAGRRWGGSEKGEE